jgi:hypothetical protein
MRDLHPMRLDEALKALSIAAPRTRMMTMSDGQWDPLLSAAYEQGWILLELDEKEQPVRAYRKAGPRESTTYE